MNKIISIILAAGEGTRMKSDLPKVLHPICGKPMIGYSVDTIRSIGIKDIVVVVGYKAREVQAALPGLECAIQKEMLGTGDAVLSAKKLVFKNKDIESVLVSYGDTPLLTKEILEKIIDKHLSRNADCTLLTCCLKNPTGYGRILRSGDNKIVKIVEELDAEIYDKVKEEVNVGVYCFKKDVLFDALSKIKPFNKKQEYYLTDVIEILSRSSCIIESVSTDNEEEFLGINTRKDLIKAGQIVKDRIESRLMEGGVTIIDPSNTYIEEGVEIKKDTIIYPYTFIESGVKIAEGCKIGPSARLRSGTIVDKNVKIGNFAELVRTRVGSNTKISHQCYLGDTVIGKSVNIGAGTIVANYDGNHKYKTVIDDFAFIGSGSILVAPVKIGKGATTGAGSVITKNKNVPAGKTVVGIPAKILKKNKNK
ncbi:MAG: NTP transferase domain-containing protein [Candidatus Omnitrophota bacterium]